MLGQLGSFGCIGLSRFVMFFGCFAFSEFCSVVFGGFSSVLRRF